MRPQVALSKAQGESRLRWSLQAGEALICAFLCSTVGAEDSPSPAHASEPESRESSFLFVPYPVTEPAIGAGFIAGPVWMRAGPPEPTGPSKPQAFGAGALWTDGGSRGVAIFDHRAWSEGRWRTTTIAGQVDLRLVYDGLLPGGNQDRGFTLELRGGSISGERRIGAGPSILGLRMFGSSARLVFDEAAPDELAGELSEAKVNGLTVSWSRDTRNDDYSPGSGHLVDAAGTFYLPGLGASFAAQGLRLKWTRYQSLGRGIIGTRLLGESMRGDPPIYLRPYVGFRGIPALRYAGERVASFEAEYRHPLGHRWEALAFGGVGAVRADRQGIRGGETVAAAGLGFRFKSAKYYGLTFGMDVAQGPDGVVTYIQVGNAWAR